MALPEKSGIILANGVRNGNEANSKAKLVKGGGNRLPCRTCRDRFTAELSGGSKRGSVSTSCGRSEHYMKI